MTQNFHIFSERLFFFHLLFQIAAVIDLVDLSIAEHDRFWIVLCGNCKLGFHFGKTFGSDDLSILN